MAIGEKFVRRWVGAAVLLGVGVHGASAAATTKIACVGASTTSGDGSSAGHHYPDELQRLVAPGGEVKNFGVSGTTMLRNVSATYWTTPQLPEALAYLPDVVIIWFGGNDAKPENWTTHKGEFLGDYESMLRMFQGLSSHPRTYVVLSLVTHDTEGIPKAVVDNEVIPLVRQAAADTGSGVVDVHDDLADHPEYFPDGIHPDDAGTIAVAMLVYATLNAPYPDGGADAADIDASLLFDGGVPDRAAGPSDVGPSDTRPSEAGPSEAGPSEAAAPPPTMVADGAVAGTLDGAASTSTGQSTRGGGCALGGSALSGLPQPIPWVVVATGWFSRRRRRGRASLRRDGAACCMGDD